MQNRIIIDIRRPRLVQRQLASGFASAGLIAAIHLGPKLRDFWALPQRTMEFASQLTVNSGEEFYCD